MGPKGGVKRGGPGPVLGGSGRGSRGGQNGQKSHHSSAGSKKERRFIIGFLGGPGPGFTICSYGKGCPKSWGGPDFSGRGGQNGEKVTTLAPGPKKSAGL